MSDLVKCEGDGCENAAREYRLVDDDGSLVMWDLCDDHAADAGFCPACGWYAAGADDDHLARHGVCYECWTQLNDEIEAAEDKW